jgi:SAM-dependent methyltransferase
MGSEVPLYAPAYAGLDVRERVRRETYGEDLGQSSFDAILSVDAMCHLPDRLGVLEEWHRVTRPNGRILFTDPTIVTGPVTGTEIADRSAVAVYVFSIASLNEELLAEAGFELLRREDLTESTAAVARRWGEARQRLSVELIADEGAATFEGVQRFLEACHVLADERRLSRYAYLPAPRN